MRNVGSAVLLALLLPPFVDAQHALPQVAPRVTTTVPLGAPLSQSVEVQFRGTHLDDAQEIRFLRPDIEAQVLRSDYYSVHRLAFG